MTGRIDERDIYISNEVVRVDLITFTDECEGAAVAGGRSAAI